ncbi:hypothetical protein BJ741DRAFT_703696 [Chytriomyces cf. hyalinus JEL632]|nr:hypothetical protein BJ741DRAFT_703696 [Chytriomyces cf. hyalinus JEL632]
MEEATSPQLTLETENEIGPHRKGIFSDPTTEALPPDLDALSPFADAFVPAGTPFACSMAATRTVPEGPARRLARLRRETATLLETVVTNMDSAPAPAPAAIVRVVHSYEAIQPDELDLVVGENIVVLDAFEESSLADAREDMYGSVSYDLFYSKVDESAGPLVDLTMLDFRITALEVTIGASLPILQPKHEAHSREWVGSMSSKHCLTSSIIQASLPPLPPALPLPPNASVSAVPVVAVKAASSDSLLLTMEESTMGLQRLLYTLESQVHDPPNIDPVQQSMENLLAIQKEAKPTLPPLSATSQRILQLHEASQPMDRLVASIPAIVNRLDSLVGLHTRAAQLSDAVIGIRAAHMLSVDRLGSVEDVLEVVDKGIKRNAEVCIKNFDALEDRVKSLLKRLNAVAYLAE